MSLRHFALAALAVTSLSSQAAISIATPTSTYTQTFNTLASSWTNDSTLEGWSLFYRSGSTISFAADTGTGTGGGFKNYGSTAAADRALGTLATNSIAASGTVAGYIAAAFKNTSGGNFDSFTISFDGEQWRNGGNAAIQGLTLEYGFGSSFASITSWTPTASSFTFSSPVHTATAGALNGNLDANRVAGLGGTISSLAWGSNETLWIRWVDTNDSGNEHGLAIDNFSLSVTAAVPEPSTYAMLLAGLGAVGLVARRRRQNP